ncbi:MAG: hypothetical protein M0P31_06360 [Solirubrobacteraceae bacterium]|nr:hypothetical protein [Solirubrobacteraceae bacterium]
MSRRTAAIDELRRTVECLPRHTQVAMLRAIREQPIIVGAYTDGNGGMCPMLGAHRYGGRTSFIAFAKSWDRFTGAPGRGRSRPATRRELRVLDRYLVEALRATDERDVEDLDPAAVTGSDLGRVIVEHRALVERNRPERARPAAGDVPSLADAIAEHRELVARHAEVEADEAVELELELEVEEVVQGRGRVRLPEWMRPLDTVADYEAALAEVDRQRVRLGLVDDTASPRDADRTDAPRETVGARG